MSKIFKLLFVFSILQTYSVICLGAFHANGIWYEASGLGLSLYVCADTSKTTGYNSYSGDVYIPSKYIYHGTAYNIAHDIIGLKDGAFANSPNLTSVDFSSITNDISFSTSIGGSMFDRNIFTNCPNLVSIKGNKRFFSTIDGVLYRQGGNTLIRCPEGKKGNLLLPAQTDTLFMGAFRNCSLRLVTIPASVSISDECFSGFKGDIVFEKGASSYDENTFKNYDGTIYAPQSEIEKIKSVYGGKVFELAEAPIYLGIIYKSFLKGIRFDFAVNPLYSIKKFDATIGSHKAEQDSLGQWWIKGLKPDSSYVMNVTVTGEDSVGKIKTSELTFNVRTLPLSSFEISDYKSRYAGILINGIKYPYNDSTAMMIGGGVAVNGVHYPFNGDSVLIKNLKINKEYSLAPYVLYQDGDTVYGGEQLIRTILPKIPYTINKLIAGFEVCDIVPEKDETVQLREKGAFYGYDEKYHPLTTDNLLLKTGKIDTLAWITSYAIYNDNDTIYGVGGNYKTVLPVISYSGTALYAGYRFENITCLEDTTAHIKKTEVISNSVSHEFTGKALVLPENGEIGCNYTFRMYVTYDTGDTIRKTVTLSSKSGFKAEEGYLYKPIVTQTQYELCVVWSVDESVKTEIKGIKYKKSDEKAYSSVEYNTWSVVLKDLEYSTIYNWYPYIMYNGGKVFSTTISNNSFKTSDVEKHMSLIESTPTTLEIEGTYDTGDVTFESAAFVVDNITYEGEHLFIKDLIPNSEYPISFYVKVEESEKIPMIVRKYKTTDVLLETLQPKCVSDSVAVVAANTNLSETVVTAGFQWRKYDAPEEMVSNQIFTCVYNGRIEGRITNLNSASFYKVRGVFVDANGKSYFGDWKVFDPSDNSFFEPTVATYSVVATSSTEATLKGYVLAGTDFVDKQGFEYWIDNPTSNKQSTEVSEILTDGQIMLATISGLLPSSTYNYRAFVQAGGNTYYGETMQFKTLDDTTIIETQSVSTPQREIIGIYDLLGKPHKELQKGINIVRFSDKSIRKIVVR